MKVGVYCADSYENLAKFKLSESVYGTTVVESARVLAAKQKAVTLKPLADQFSPQCSQLKAARILTIFFSRLNLTSPQERRVTACESCRQDKNGFQLSSRRLSRIVSADPNES